MRSKHDSILVKFLAIMVEFKDKYLTDCDMIQRLGILYNES